MARSRSPLVRPMLKWAGGKRQLLPAFRPVLPGGLHPLYRALRRQRRGVPRSAQPGRLDGREARLSDINADIIGCYTMVRDAVEEVITALAAMADGHRALGRAHFYQVRDERFNPARRRIHAERDPEARYTPELAAMLIYLNRTGYNGLFRVNRRGTFNVPAGTARDDPHLRRGQPPAPVGRARPTRRDPAGRARSSRRSRGPGGGTSSTWTRPTRRSAARPISPRTTPRDLAPSSRRPCSRP